MDGNNSRPHPYYPRDLEIPHYVPNDMDMMQILSIFGVSLLVVSVVLLVVMSQLSRRLSFATKLKCLWFLICGMIHVVLEGYFSLHHKTLAGEQTLLAQTWKEYSKGDSRYLMSDTFVVCMESITAFFDGPLAFIALYAFLSQRPYRYAVQMIVSLCQLYGCVLYFLTEVKEDFIHGEMYHFVYFWIYFTFINSVWIVIPVLYILESVWYLSKAQAIADARISGKKKKA